MERSPEIAWRKGLFWEIIFSMFSGVKKEYWDNRKMLLVVLWSLLRRVDTVAALLWKVSCIVLRA